MDEVNNPQRLLAKNHLGSYDESDLSKLKAEVFFDVSGIAKRYGIVLDEELVFKNIEALDVSVCDYSEQKTFLQELVILCNRLRQNDCSWKIYGLRIDSRRINGSINIKQGMIYGLVKELEAFVKSEKEKNSYVDNILIRQLKNYLIGDTMQFPQKYYDSLEDYLFDSIDFTYTELNMEKAAHSLAICFLNRKPYHIDKTGLVEDGWNLSIKEGAFIYDMLHYTGYVEEEQWKDKDLEPYKEKCKYDMVKRFFK